MKRILKPRFTSGFKNWQWFGVILSIIWLGGVLLLGLLLAEDAAVTNLAERNQEPSLDHLFGTDWMGRDMFARTLSGLGLSIGVGLIGAASSSIIAVILGLAAAAFGKTADRIISWLIDLFLSVPHLVALILISFTLGGGFKGIVAGIALTHWPTLARVIRAEAMQIRSADYVRISSRLGKTKSWIAVHHFIPHLLPQFIIGFMLMFPHAILHEAAVTFLGLGLSPHEPAIGIILSESMRYLSSGMWWLAVFPGLCLLFVVRSFDIIGEYFKSQMDPLRTHH